MTTEFASGMALVSLTVAPRRTRLLRARTVVLAVVTALMTAVLALGCVLPRR